MFSSYRMMHALEHLPLLMASFLIPLFALCLFKAVEEPTTKHWVFCALVWAPAPAWVVRHDLLFIYLVLFVVVLAVTCAPDSVRRHLRPVAVALCVLVVTASPFVLPLMISQAGTAS